MSNARRFTAYVCVATVGALVLGGPSAVAAQGEGSLTGAILNGLTGQPVRGASLEVEGTETHLSSDLDGLFRASLPAGTYSLRVVKEGFDSQRVTDVVIAPGEVNTTSVVLMPSQEAQGAGEEQQAAFGGQITVTAEAAVSTEGALLAERKGAAQISDSIGTEEISRSTGSDAAGVLKRVTGISLQGNKYVFVRGLGDRYSSTSLNGSKIPSTEFEKKVVPLDLFPSDLLEKIVVSKSYTVDKPGDFVAGLVELVTKEFPVRQTASVGYSLGSNSNTTGDPYLRYDDGLSFSGSGGQALPASIPDEALARFSRFTGRGFTPDELETFGEALVGTWTPSRRGSAPADQSFNGSYGNIFGKLGFVLSATHESGFANRDEEANIFRGSAQGVVPLNEYDLQYSDEKVRQSFTGNLSYRFGDNHHVRLRSLDTRVATSESRFQEGFFSDISSNIENFRLSYLEQDVLSNQLSGDHYFATLGSGALLEWKVSQSAADTAENRRETLYEELTPGELVLTDNAQSGFIYFNDLEDDVLDSRVDWSSFLNGSKVFGSVKGGVAYTRNERDFAGRRLRFFHRNTRGLDLTLPAEELFTPDNIGPNGFELEEITRPTDTYTGDHDIYAAYVQADLGWNKWRLIGGVRVEDSDQRVVTFNRFRLETPPIVSRVANTDLLPSVSLVYQLSQATNLRVSASRTVNRPEYRELAPFEFTHIVGGFTVAGNPDLERAEITSFDTRWEWFLGGGEVVAASVFYKEFDRPIENVLLSGATPRETFQNVPSARNLGFELELRRDLDSLSPKLKGWTALVNYTFVDSEVSLNEDETVLTNKKRALVGQPDNVLNLILEWQSPAWGSGLRLLYNFVGDKVFQAGGFGLPDVIEDARSAVDVVWRQDLGAWARGLSLKLSAQNLLDEEWRWSQGGETYRLFEPGRKVGFSVSYSLF